METTWQDLDRWLSSSPPLAVDGDDPPAPPEPTPAPPPQPGDGNAELVT